MIAGRVEYVQSIRLASDAVDLAVEVLDGRRVTVDEACPEEASHNGRLADPSRSEQDQSTTVLGGCVLCLRHELLFRRWLRV